MALKILHVSTVHRPYDTRIFYKECRALADYGYNVELATTVDSPTIRDQVELHPLGSPRRSRLWRVVRNIRALRIVMSRNDIVHIHDPELLIVGAWASLFGHSVVYDVHEFYYERIGESGWIPRPLRHLAKGMYRAIERLIVPRLAGVVVVNPTMVEHYVALINRNRVAVVQNFPYITKHEIDEARATQTPLSTPYIIHTGGVSRSRAFDLIVAAAEILRESNNNTPIINLGDIDLSEYPPATRQELQIRARAAGVEMLGQLPYHETLSWLAHAEVGYIPLASGENNARGTPNKLFEYLLFGLPIVATSLGRIKDVVEETGSGLLVPPEQPKAHANALLHVMSDPQFNNSLRVRAQAASSSFNFSTELSRLISLYKEICGSKT